MAGSRLIRISRWLVKKPNWMLFCIVGFGGPMAAFAMYKFTHAHMDLFVALLFALPIALCAGWLFGWATFKLFVDPGVARRFRPSDGER